MTWCVGVNGWALDTVNSPERMSVALPTRRAIECDHQTELWGDFDIQFGAHGVYLCASERDSVSHVYQLTLCFQYVFGSFHVACYVG